MLCCELVLLEEWLLRELALDCVDSSDELRDNGREHGVLRDVELGPPRLHRAPVDEDDEQSLGLPPGTTGALRHRGQDILALVAVGGEGGVLWEFSGEKHEVAILHVHLHVEPRLQDASQLAKHVLVAHEALLARIEPADRIRVPIFDFVFFDLVLHLGAGGSAKPFAERLGGMYVLMFYVTGFALTELKGVSIAAILIGFILASFSIAATNGGIGSFPEAVVIAFAIFGLSEDPSRAFGWIMWSSQTLMIIVLGGISLIYLPIYNRKRKEV